jgi:hypothetical protein
MLASSRMAALRIIVASMVSVSVACLCWATSQILPYLISSFACLDPLGLAMTKPHKGSSFLKLSLSSIASTRMQSDSLQFDNNPFYLQGGVFIAFSCIHPSPHRGTSFTINQMCWNMNSEFLGLLIQYNSFVCLSTTAALLPNLFRFMHCWCTPMNLAMSCLICFHLESSDQVGRNPWILLSS